LIIAPKSSAADGLHDLDAVTVVKAMFGVTTARQDLAVQLDCDAPGGGHDFKCEPGDGDSSRHLTRDAIEDDLHRISLTRIIAAERDHPHAIEALIAQITELLNADHHILVSTGRLRAISPE